MGNRKNKLIEQSKCCGKNCEEKTQKAVEEISCDDGCIESMNSECGCIEEDKNPTLTMIMVIVSGVALLWSFLSGSESGLSLLPRLPFPVPFDDTAWLAVVLCGWPLIRGAFNGVVKRRDISAGVLVSIALVAAVIIGEIFAAGEVAFIMMIGELLERRTVAHANESLQKLINLAPEQARRRTAEGIEEVSVKQLAVGDIVVVKPGERLPVDGVVVVGFSAVDQSAITGESMPVDKALRDTVYAGTVNGDGALEIEATAVGERSSLQKIIDLMKRAGAAKAPVSRTADRWARIIVPVALLVALATLIVSLLLHLPDAITRAVTILVVFCPCALVLATPTAIMAAIGNASRHGVLVKSGVALEAAGRIDAVALDKTGTLTMGKPFVAEILPFYGTAEEVLSLAAAVESMSSHPIACAITAHALSTGVMLKDALVFINLPGRGTSAMVDGTKVSIGSRRMAAELGIEATAAQCAALDGQEAQGRTLALVAAGSSLAGVIALSDKAKPNAGRTVKTLQSMGMTLTLVTGDNGATARSIGNSLGIQDIRAEALPSDKVALVEELQRQGRRVAMVGDGINDAPALARADIGIAMGALGTDIAIEAAGIAIMADDIGRVADVLWLAKKTLRKINANIIISMSINIVAVCLAVTGLMGPALGAIVHNLGSVLVVANSALLITQGIKDK